MGLLPMEYDSGWSAVTELKSHTYGTLRGSYNKNLKMAFLAWTGNSSSPSSSTSITETLDSNYCPLSPSASASLTENGCSIIMRNNNQVEVTIAANKNWTVGSVTYPTA